MLGSLLRLVLIIATMFIAFNTWAGPIDSNNATQEELLLSQARVFLQSKENANAEKAYLNVLEINPNSIPAYIGLAQVEFSLGKKVGAQRQFEKAFEINNENAALHTAYARFLMATQNIVGAKKHLQKALNINPELPQANVELAVIMLSRENNAKAAVSLYEKAIEHAPNNITYLYGLSQAQKQSGQTDKAQASLDKIIMMNGELSLPYKLKGLYYREQGNYKDAIPNYKKSLDKNPQANFTEYLTYGELYLESNQYADAIEVFNEVLVKFGENAASFTKVGYAHHMKGSLDKAQQYYKKAIELDDRFPDPYNNLAYIVKSTSLSQALEYSNKAVTLAPNNPYFLDTLGGLYIDLQEYQKAKPHLEKALQIMPSYRDASEKLQLVKRKLS